ncbi:MAG: hypothetical protein JJU00_07900 [Opitutales bacterium]|nr:hypothetical protein [Opitutales bacterium]
MSGRSQPFYGKRRAKTKQPGAKPNARRQRELAKRRKKHLSSGLHARREERKAQSAEV